MENKTKFFNVILQCPINDPDNDCVFNRYREMPITELIEVSQALKPAEIEYLLARHTECLNKRKANKLAS